MSFPPLTPTAWLRYDVVKRFLDQVPNVASVLEIGVGEGALGARLASRFDYLGVEPDAASFATAKTRIGRYGGHVIQGDGSAIPPETTFDLVCAFEVLEHIEDDRSALMEWRTRINAKGWLLVSVPAIQRRYGPWDARAGHFRRYEPKQLADTLIAAGFSDPRVRTYGFPLGYLLEWARHRTVGRSHVGGSMADRTAASGRALQPPDGLAWVTRLGTAPFRVLQRPFAGSQHGIGLVALARRAD